MLEMLVLAFLVVGGAVAHPSVRCPNNFDYSVGRSCFKYVTDNMLLYDHARTYCQRNLGGRLAVLDSRRKLKATIDFFHEKFAEEEREGGVPTAWVEGHWIPGTTHLRYGNGKVDKRPHWMTSTRNKDTGKLFRWPTSSLFGWEATCIAVSLWKPGIPDLGVRASAGFYNVPCNSIYWTHALCEVTN
ncbi:unnamed protein product [Clavelina lepadiformis]|uniref:C-type lectin domain-containing protein n=1 Tax=Clavelina lepadiformis TaxID=159417 RepID=A0ABP0FEE3_CLALP